MDCREFERAISKEDRIPACPLPQPLSEHVQECPHCRELMRMLTEKGTAFSVSPALIERIAVRITSDLERVTPVPSGSRLMWMFTGIFLTLVATGLQLLPPLGLMLMSGSIAVLILTLLTLSAALLVFSLSRQMVPASLSHIPPLWLVFGIVITLAVLFLVALPGETSPDFWKEGWPCFSIGIGFALAAGMLYLVVLRRGAVTDLHLTGLSAGLLAGLSGLTVLEIHCPILESAHALAWHLGAVAVAALAGAGLPRLWND